MLLRIGLLQIHLSAQRFDGAAGTHEHPSFQDGSSVKAEVLLNRRKDQTYRYLATHARQV